MASVSILSRLRPTLPANSQVCLTHCKRGSLALLLSFWPSCSVLSPLFPFFPFPSPLSSCSHGQLLLLYSLSAFLCLYYPLNSPPHSLNKMSETIPWYSWSLMGKGCLSMGLQRNPLSPHPPSITSLLIFL